MKIVETAFFGSVEWFPLGEPASPGINASNFISDVSYVFSRAIDLRQLINRLSKVFSMA